MRLIDVDILPEVDTIERIDGERDVFVNSWIPAAAIWKAPTVEAIPIEWLKELQTKYLEAECFMSVCVVNEMLNLWRKENGTDR